MKESPGFAFGAPDDVKAVRELIDAQPKQRMTKGTKERTYAFHLLKAYAADFDVPEYAELAEELADSWGGHDGWAMDSTTKMVSAAKIQTMMVSDKDKKK